MPSSTLSNQTNPSSAPYMPATSTPNFSGSGISTGYVGAGANISNTPYFNYYAPVNESYYSNVQSNTQSIQQTYSPQITYSPQKTYSPQNTYSPTYSPQNNPLTFGLFNFGTPSSSGSQSPSITTVFASPNTVQQQLTPAQSLALFNNPSQLQPVLSGLAAPSSFFAPKGTFTTNPFG